jgi:hypothetical protein
MALVDSALNVSIDALCDEVPEVCGCDEAFLNALWVTKG